MYNIKSSSKYKSLKTYFLLQMCLCITFDVTLLQHFQITSKRRNIFLKKIFEKYFHIPEKILLRLVTMVDYICFLVCLFLQAQSWMLRINSYGVKKWITPQKNLFKKIFILLIMNLLIMQLCYFRILQRKVPEQTSQNKKFLVEKCIFFFHSDLAAATTRHQVFAGCICIVIAPIH